MSPLRARMIEDMTLAGLAVGTQKIYIQSVRRLAAHYRRSPDQLSVSAAWLAAHSRRASTPPAAPMLPGRRRSAGSNSPCRSR
jgi:hypothetical protein